MNAAMVASILGLARLDGLGLLGDAEGGDELVGLDVHQDARVDEHRRIRRRHLLAGQLPLGPLVLLRPCPSARLAVADVAAGLGRLPRERPLSRPGTRLRRVM